MLFVSLLLALVSYGEASGCTGEYWAAPANLWGDPHITTFNQVYMHFQGNMNKNGYANDGTGRPNEVLYYLMTSCDTSTTDPPYRMVGAFTRYVNGPMTVLNYVTLELYDDATGEVYYVFLTPGRYVNDNVKPIRRYYTKSQGATADIAENNQNGLTAVGRLGAGDNQIGGKFTINLSGDLDFRFTTVLTIKSLDGTTCTLTFIMQLGDTPAYQYRWNHLNVAPPTCDRCNICGLLGDFQTPLGQPKLLECDGETYKGYTTNWTPSQIEFETPGWTYEYNTYNSDECMDDSSEPCDGCEPTECPAELLEEIEAAVQVQRDANRICCRNLGGAFCTNLQEGAVDDICIRVDGDDSACIEDLVQEYFTAIVQAECANQGKFGPVPKLLYEFQNGYEETISDGNPQYDLQSTGDATIVNGILNCDGSGDYVYSENNFDFNVGDHSLEVLVAITNLGSVGGGAIAIDGNYRQSDGYYAHDQFDSIVFNEYGGRRTWILGSDYWRRTRDTTGTVRDSSTAESVANIYLQMVAVYDATNNVAKLYRNGQLELSYTPQGGFMTPDADPLGSQGTRIMFCQRHLNAGSNDLPGKIAYGAYYDYALSDQEVSILYSTGVVNINGVPYENVGDELRPDQLLTAGQALVSTSGQYAAAMQQDGQFRIYDLVGGTSTCITTGTAVPGTSYLVLQSSDGNVVQYDGNGGNTFNSGAMPSSLSDASPLMLLMQSDGNLVAYAADSQGLIAYYDSNGHTSGGPLRPGASSSGFADYFGLDSFNGFVGNDGESTSSMSYLLYLVGFLLITNIICLTVYCLKKQNNNKRRYKVVSIDSSDAEEVNLK